MGPKSADNRRRGKGLSGGATSGEKASQVAKPNETTGVITPPILTFGKNNNFVVWEKLVILFLVATFGLYGSFAEHNRHWVPPMVDIPAIPYTAANDPMGLRRKLLEEELKDLQAAVAKRATVFPKMSAVLWSLVGTNSRSAIKGYRPPAALASSGEESDSSSSDDESESSSLDDEPDPSGYEVTDVGFETQAQDGAEPAAAKPAVVEGPLPYPVRLHVPDAGPITYVNWKAGKDPLVLWRLIVATHRGAATGSAVTDAVQAHTRYAAMRQGAQESTADFKERVDAALLAIKASGLPLPSKRLQAAIYIEALNNERYADLKQQLNVNENMGLATRPKTLHRAHNMAMRFTYKATTSPTSETTPGSVFIVNAATGGRGGRGSGRGAGTGGRNGRGAGRTGGRDGGRDRSAESGGPRRKQGADQADDGYVNPGGMQCLICGSNTHLCARCPKLGEVQKTYGGGKQVNALMDEVVFVAVRCTGIMDEFLSGDAECVTSAHVRTAGLSDYDVILDSGAMTPIVYNSDLLTNVRTCEPLILKGIGGHIRVTQCGDFEGFGEVYYSEKSPVNVLSFAGTAARVVISYDYHRGGGCFVTHQPTGDVRFECHGGLFVHRFESRTVMVQTVAEREAKYTKRQVADAQAARELMKNLGYPSNADLVKLMNSGALMNSPVTKQDVYRALDIYGPDVASLKGKTKSLKAPPVKIERVPLPAETELTLHADIMFVHKDPSLIVVCTPLGLVLHKHLLGRTALVLTEAFKQLLAELQTRGFRAVMLLSDGEGGIAKIASALGMPFNPAGPEQHVPVVEAKIRVIKERMRAVLSTLPFKLPLMLLRWCVAYVVTRVNMLPSSLRVDATSPRELFLGRKVDAKNDLRFGFGDYVQAKVENSISNSMTPRTTGCIALNSVGNLQGSWKFYCLATGGIQTHDQVVKMPMPDSVIAHMNTLAGDERKGCAGTDPTFQRGTVMIDLPPQAAEPVQQDEPPRQAAQLEPAIVGEDVPAMAPGTIIDSAAAPAAAPVPPPAAEQVSVQPDAVGPEDELPMPPPASEEDDESSDEEDGGAEATSVPPPSAPPREEDPLPRRNPAREGRTSWRERYGFHISVSKAIETFGDKAAEAIRAELQQMDDNKVFTPCNPAELSKPEFKAVIHSSMFLKEKFTPEGAFDKLKARLVASGNQQDKTLYPVSSVSSPAVALPTVFMGAGIAAAEGRHVVTMDIVGAYLKIDMTGRKVRMRLPAYVAKIMCEIRPDYKPFVLRDGSLIVRLDKALYGCIESGRLLFNHIKSTLTGMGFKQNPYDQCTFNKGPLESQCTVLVYVDDLFISCRDATIHRATVNAITGVYETVKVTEGLVHSYLGMTMDFSAPGDVKITMNGFVDELLSKHPVTGTATSPASVNLFERPAIDAPLEKSERETFHSVTQKLLYLSKRVRPETLLAVAFLTTRVTAPTDSDQVKLMRVLKYLNGTRGLGLVLSFGKGMVLENFVDVAFGVHSDYKSHTGAVTTLGKGAFDVKSTKQKLVTKSSTEAELVGVSDYSSEILHKREFLLAQGYKMGPAVLYQDNMSTIAMLKNGRASSDRTRHINIRYFFVKDRVDAGEIRVEYKPTEQMIADILTKPVQGALFLKLRAWLLNWPA